MTVDKAIDRLSRDADYTPLVKCLEMGRGYGLEEFCANVKFTPPKLTEDSLLRLVRNYVSSAPPGIEPPRPLLARVGKATGPVLASVIETLGAAPAGKLSDRKRQIEHYLVQREFPSIPAKKARAKRAQSKLDPQAVIDEFVALKAEARNLGIDEIDRRFEAIFKKKGCTVAVIGAVLKSENLDGTGNKRALLDRLKRIPRTLAGDRARESFA